MVGAISATLAASAVFIGLQLGQGTRQGPEHTGEGEQTVGEYQHTNQLADESSPYLLQHAHNPVNWYPWREDALQKAKEEDKPIIVSIGYSACHWCHVMERESFENEAIAATMNEHFVCIKVDREERPDLDEVYMSACQILTGAGGWPLNVFLTPELKPFYAGTYFPPDDRYGRPGWPSVLEKIAEVYRDDREGIEASATEITKALSRPMLGDGGSAGPVSYRLIDEATDQFRTSFDPKWGGFGGAPKFPGAASVRLLLRQHHRLGDEQALKMATVTLDRMARGGMYDQLGGGFHRYSVDEKWLVPHFEKMLYDNALLTVAYLEAYQLTGYAYYARIARETLDYVLREMTDEAGGFHSTIDADSEGEEGKYFVWSPDEVTDLLGKKGGKLFGEFYDVSEAGNFEGHSILNVPVPAAQFAEAHGMDTEELEAKLAACRETLLEARGERIPPGKDDKILADWNGLMISAFARGYQVLGDERYREAAECAAGFVLTKMQPDGQLQHAYRHGKSYQPAFLDDYAFVLEGFLDLYEATFDAKWVSEARGLAETMMGGFWDAEGGGFYFTVAGREDLITRPKKTVDGATPSGNSVAASALLRLGRLTGDERYAERAAETLKAAVGQAERIPQAFPALLIAVDAYLGEPTDVVIAGDPQAEDADALVAAAREGFVPNRIVAVVGPDAKQDGGLEGVLALTEAKGLVNGKPAAYVCDGRGCLAPVTGPEELRGLLSRDE